MFLRGPSLQKKYLVLDTHEVGSSAASSVDDVRVAAEQILPLPLVQTSRFQRVQEATRFSSVQLN